MLSFIEQKHVIGNTAYLLGIQWPSYSDILNKALEIFGQSPMTKENAKIANDYGEGIEYGFYFALSYYMHNKFGENSLLPALTKTILLEATRSIPKIKEVIQEQAADYVEGSFIDYVKDSFIINAAVNIVVHTIYSVSLATLGNTLSHGMGSDTSSLFSAAISGVSNGLIASVIENFAMMRSEDFIVSDAAAAIFFATVAGIVAIGSMPAVTGAGLLATAAMSVPAIICGLSAGNLAYLIVDGFLSNYFSTPENADVHQKIVNSYLDMTGQIQDMTWQIQDFVSSYVDYVM